MGTPNRPTRYLLTLLAGTVLWVQAGLAAEVAHVSNITDGLTSPTSLTVTDDGIAVLEPFARRIVVFTSGGIVTNEVDISGEVRGLSRLVGRTYLFCERSAGAVIRVNLDTGLQDVFLADAGDPVDIIVSDNQCRILDADQQRVLLCDQAGRRTGTIKLAVPNDQSAAWLADLAWDRERDLYYAWDQTHSRVLVFDATGSYQGGFSSFGGTEGAVTRGGEIACDQDGWIFISDRYQGQIVVFDTDWNFVLNIQPQALGSEPLVVPAGLAIDPTGFVYVASTEGPAIEVFHLDKASSPLRLPVATAISPAHGDTISGGSLRLVAGIQAPAELAAGLTVAFRLFALPETTTPVAEISGLSLTEPVVAGATVVGTATWVLPGDLDTGATFQWQVRAASDGSAGSWSELRDFTKGVVPPVFRLEQNVPNPFNPLTTISFVLTGTGTAQLGIFDIRGRLVWRQDLAGLKAGQHKVQWNGTDTSGNSLASGVYFFRLVEGSRSDTRKMVLMK